MGLLLVKEESSVHAVLTQFGEAPNLLTFVTHVCVIDEPHFFSFIARLFSKTATLLTHSGNNSIAEVINLCQPVNIIPLLLAAMQSEGCSSLRLVFGWHMVDQWRESEDRERRLALSKVVLEPMRFHEKEAF